MMYKVLLIALCAGSTDAFFRRWRKPKNECLAVDVMPGFNTTEYVRASWYIQYQQETRYQKEEDLYCVVATYERENKKALLFNKPAISVYNFGNVGAVNGPLSNADGMVLCARQKDDKVPAKILVAPCFLPNLFAGSYWVLAAGPSADNYQWAVVSGGQPSEKYDDGCTTRADTVNESGLWIFSRQPVIDEASLKQARDLLVEKGYTLSQLKPVQQEGCTYEGARIKPDTHAA